MVSPSFLFFVSFTLVTLGYIECYPCSPGFLKRQANLNENKELQEFLKNYTRGKENPNPPIGPDGLRQSNKGNGKRMNIQGKPPRISTEENGQPILRVEEPNHTKRDDTFDEDQFKRTMASELYLELRKQLDSIEDYDK